MHLETTGFGTALRSPVGPLIQASGDVRGERYQNAGK